MRAQENDMATQQSSASKAVAKNAGPGPLTLEKAKQIFSFRGKNDAGEGVDMELVRTHYHPNVHFQDAIQVIEGRDAVVEMMVRFPGRCDDLYCTVHNAMQQGNIIFLEWSMTMRVDPLPEMTNHGVTRLTLDDDGMVIRHRDFFDLWGDMIDAFPRVAKLYRSAVRHLE
jgi:hypothetical protein